MFSGKAGRAYKDFGAGGVSFTVGVFSTGCAILRGYMYVKGFVKFTDDYMAEAGVRVKEFLGVGRGVEGDPHGFGGLKGLVDLGLDKVEFRDGWVMGLEF